MRIAQTILFSVTMMFGLMGCVAPEKTTDAQNSENYQCEIGDTRACQCDSDQAGEQRCDAILGSRENVFVEEGSEWGACDCEEEREENEKPADVCEEDNDCRKPGACPNDADQGCACTEIAWGIKLCIPLCGKDRDCPQDPAEPMECNDEGLCVEKTNTDPVIILPGEGEGEQFQPPSPCEDQADCEDCPYEMGCTCYAGGNGNKRCRPNCAVDEDCPQSANATFICNDDKVCIRDRDGGEPGGEGEGEGEAPNTPILSPCEKEADCAADDACPSDAAQGCTCISAKNGNQICAPKCTANSDCPTSLPIDMLCGGEGYCVLDNGGPGGPGG